MASTGASERAFRNGTSSFLRMRREEVDLHPAVTLAENSAAGRSPSFDSRGFLKQPRVSIIEGGKLQGSLISPQTAAEHGLETNAANLQESPVSLDMAAGDVNEEDILARLDRGLYLGRLHYLNYSDRTAGRIRGSPGSGASGWKTARSRRRCPSCVSTRACIGFSERT